MAQSSPHSLPLQMVGFLAGTTIHVHGEAGNLHFSGQFQINHNQSLCNTAGTEFPENQSSQMPGFSAATLLSCTTPSQPHEVAIHSNVSPIEFPALDKPEVDNTSDFDQNQGSMQTQDKMAPTEPTNPSYSAVQNQPPGVANGTDDHPTEFCNEGKPEFDGTPECDQTPRIKASQEISSVEVKTRLRSGTLRRMNYFPLAIKRVADEVLLGGCSSVPLKSKSTRRGRRTGDAVERVLRQHSLPKRPCNAYCFFVTTKWGQIRSNSFQETSRRLRDMWRELGDCDKKEYEEVAGKDRQRYKRQCELLQRK